MMQLLAIIQKEFLLLSRDIHGLLLLFIMPLVFILIMSLAMQDDFTSRAGGKIDVLLHSESDEPLNQRFIELMNQNAVFKWVVLSNKSEEELIGSVGNDQYKFMVSINEHFSDQILTQDNIKKSESAVNITVAPSASRQMEMIFQSIVQESIARLRLENMLAQLSEAMPDFDTDEIADQLEKNDILAINYGGDQNNLRDSSDAPPSSVQQSVPAWLVFSLFFIVVPLSNTLINERQLGTLKRIRTINVNPLAIVVGKLIPFFFINQIQVVLMLLVGMYLVPVFGGDSLTLGSSLLGLSMMSVAISCAALGYAMLIAVIARTSEQATTLGGTGNIILAAIGGIMVPTFIMPQFMQSLSQLSPMSWGLQGYLDILLRGGDVSDILPEMLRLVLFGAVCLVVSAALFRRQNQNS